MTRRYYHPGSLIPAPEMGSRLKLEGDEARHFLQVMRGQIGQEIELFDGQGAASPVVVVETNRGVVIAEVVGPTVLDPPPCVPLHIAVGLPKGERQKWLVEKLTELGAASLTLLETTRGVAEAGDRVASRLVRTSLEACKQCGRNRLLTISPGAPISRFLEETRSPFRWIAHLSAEAVPIESALAGVSKSSEMQPEITIAIGPEGGFSPEEIQLARNFGWSEISLGEYILRVETAAIAAAAAIPHLRARSVSE